MLQPINFVPAEFHRTLFQQVDEILQLPKSSSEEKEDHLPTANDVAKVFGLTQDDETKDSTPQETSDKEISSIRVEVEASSLTIFNKLEAINSDQSNISIEPQPPPKPTPPEVIAGVPEEDFIVYEPPARISRATTPASTLNAKVPVPELPAQPAVTMDNLTFSFEKSATIVPQDKPFSGNRTPRKSSKPSRKGKEPVRFGSFGAALEEQRLNAMVESSHRPGDKRHDSDVDWGNESDDSEDVEDGNDMLDPEVNQDGFGGFLNSLKQLNGSNQVTIDDLEDADRLQLEDDDSESGSGDEDEKSSEQDDEVDLAGSSFQARLARLRLTSKKPDATRTPVDDDDDEDEEPDLADQIEAFLNGDLEISDDSDIDLGEYSKRNSKN